MINWLVPHQHLPSVIELDLDHLRDRGICGIIFDLDNTLGSWGFTAWDERVLAWLTDVEAAGFRIAFLSNDEGVDRDAVRAGLNGHPLKFGAGKPGRSGFDEMLRALDMDASEVAMIGDQIFTDVLGARRVGMHAVLVRPVDPHNETPSTRLRRWLERQILRLSGQWRPAATVSTLDPQTTTPRRMIHHDEDANDRRHEL